MLLEFNKDYKNNFTDRLNNLYTI